MTRGQLALVHVAKKDLGLDDEAYRDILHVEAGVTSARDLTPSGLERVLARFREMGWPGPGRRTGGWRRSRPRALKEPFELPTPGQQGLIGHLWEDLGWPPGERRIAFARRVCDGMAWPQTREQANRLIEALKAMVRRGYDERRPRRPGRAGGRPST